MFSREVSLNSPKNSPLLNPPLACFCPGAKLPLLPQEVRRIRAAGPASNAVVLPALHPQRPCRHFSRRSYVYFLQNAAYVNATFIHGAPRPLPAEKRCLRRVRRRPLGATPFSLVPRGKSGVPRLLLMLQRAPAPLSVQKALPIKRSAH